MDRLKVLLMADKTVGARIANFLIENYPADLALVVTTEINEIYLEATNKQIPVCIFDSEANVLDRLGGDIDLGILAWWPKIIKSTLIDEPRLGFLNTHPSLLPFNRGKHYNFWAIVEQVPFGVTLHFVDSGIDTGNIVAQSKIDYDWSDNGETLYYKAQVAMVELFCKIYPKIRTGKIESIPQNPDKGSFHLGSELDSACKINLDEYYRGRDLLNLLRARTFEGHPGCWFEEDDIRYEVSIKIKKKKI
jgi:methionyl-tRNA formyltransferase